MPERLSTILTQSLACYQSPCYLVQMLGLRMFHPFWEGKPRAASELSAFSPAPVVAFILWPVF